MTDFVPPNQAGSRRGWALLVAVVIVATVGTLGLIVHTSVVLGRMTSELGLAQPRVTNLANSQREILRLSQSVNSLSAAGDMTDVSVQRALLARQLSVSINSFPVASSQSRELRDIQDAVARAPWDQLAGSGGDSDAARGVTVADLADNERRIKVLFDEQEKIFYSRSIGSLAAQQRSQVAIAALVCLDFTLGIGWMVKLRRRARNDLASAYTALVEEMRERRLLQADLAHQAAHDPLTGLANRAQMLRLIQAALSRGERSGSTVGLLFIDLDRFKVVNDTLGHAVGDEVLSEAAGRMSRLVRAGDTVGRLGGDEFVVLVESLADPAELVGLSDRLISSVSAPFTALGHEVTIGASVGVSFSQDGSPRASQLLHEADVAAYDAKAAGRGCARIFDDALRCELEERAELAAAISSGLDAGEFLLHYQPVVDLITGAEHGYEALIRWQRPGHGWIAPDDFIPTAERSQLICGIDRWVLREATVQLAGWIRSDPEAFRDVTVAVNISGRHLASPDIVTDVVAALETARLPANRLVLEITETVLVDEPTATVHLSALRQIGVAVSIDDFGTGYTSIGQLQHLQVDVLKIDRSFIAASTPGTEALVTLMVNAGHSFGLHVIAEGVEDDEDLATVIRLGCDSAQGYHFARPQPATNIPARRRRPAITSSPTSEGVPRLGVPAVRQPRPAVVTGDKTEPMAGRCRTDS